MENTRITLLGEEPIIYSVRTDSRLAELGLAKQ
jgi:hypothetical protein